MVLTLPWAILSSYHKAFLQMAPGCPRMQGSEDPTQVEKSMSFAISGKIKALSSAICMILSTQITPQWMAGKGQHCTIIYDNHPTASDTNHWNTERLRALVVVYNELATLSKCQQAVRLYPFYGTCCRLFLLQLRSEMSNMSNMLQFSSWNIQNASHFSTHIAAAAKCHYAASALHDQTYSPGACAVVEIAGLHTVRSMWFENCNSI